MTQRFAHAQDIRVDGIPEADLVGPVAGETSDHEYPFVMLTVFLVLAATAFICTIVCALGKCSPWVPILLLCVIELLRALPLGK